MENKMLNKIKLWLALRNLKNATRHEAELRASLEHMHEVVLPELEYKVECCEIVVHVDKFLAGSK